MLICISMNWSFFFVVKNKFPCILFTDETNQESLKIKSDKNTSTKGIYTSRLHTFSIPENYPGREGKLSSKKLYKVSLVVSFYYIFIGIHTCDSWTITQHIRTWPISDVRHWIRRSASFLTRLYSSLRPSNRVNENI